MGTQAFTRKKLCPDNAWDQIHVQTTGQCCVLGLQSSLSNSAVYSHCCFQVVSTALNVSLCFLFLHHFLQGAKGFIKSPSPRVPAYLLLFKILGSLHCSVPGESGLLCLWPLCQPFEYIAKAVNPSQRQWIEVDVKCCVTRGLKVPFVLKVLSFLHCFRNLCWTHYPGIIPL